MGKKDEINKMLEEMRNEIKKEILLEIKQEKENAVNKENEMFETIKEMKDIIINTKKEPDEIKPVEKAVWKSDLNKS